jgi:transcription antitermination protein NusB
MYEADQLGLADIPEHEDLVGKARRLAEGAHSHRVELDSALDAVSDHWRVDRMPVVDRAILRLALYELRYERETPTGVVLSEAVRIAKEFSTEKSGLFVNGVLGALALRERPDGPVE